MLWSMLSKIFRIELASPVRVLCSQLATCLRLCRCLVLFDCICCRILSLHHLESHEPASIINEQDKVAISIRGCWCDWPTNVTMYKFQYILCPVLSLIGKWSLSLLSIQAPSTKLFHMLNFRQPSHHLHLSKTAEHSELEAPELHVPEPCAFCPLRHRTHRLGNPQIHHIQMIRRLLYLR
jgi:hypothetical protein